MMFYTFTLFFMPFAWTVNDKILIRLRPEQIMDSFKSVISSEYLRLLANDFAKKAAEHLISEMKNQEKSLYLENRSPEERSLIEPPIDKHLDKQQVLTLLREPAPDGDNLEAELLLSEEENKADKPSEPQRPLKINGAYYRRYFGE